MNVIKHKFRTHSINNETKTLIIGTFNPDVPKNEADFFYGRRRNYLWQLLPETLNQKSLKNENKQIKLEFMKKNNIDFADLISEIQHETGQENNYADEYIDGKVTKWKNITDIIRNSKINEVYFTRKTFTNINNIKTRIMHIEEYCKKNDIYFGYLPTPARFYNTEKLKEWKKVMRRN